MAKELKVFSMEKPHVQVTRMLGGGVVTLEKNGEFIVSLIREGKPIRWRKFADRSEADELHEAWATDTYPEDTRESDRDFLSRGISDGFLRLSDAGLGVGKQAREAFFRLTQATGVSSLTQSASGEQTLPDESEAGGTNTVSSSGSFEEDTQ